MIAPGMMPPIAVPSFGAMVVMYCAALAVPAPGMFLTTMVGSPGMWRPRWRATARA